MWSRRVFSLLFVLGPGAYLVPALPFLLAAPSAGAQEATAYTSVCDTEISDEVVKGDPSVDEGPARNLCVVPRNAIPIPFPSQRPTRPPSDDAWRGVTYNAATGEETISDAPSHFGLQEELLQPGARMRGGDVAEGGEEGATSKNFSSLWRIAHAAVYPYRPVCKLSMTFPGASNGFVGSGCLLDPRHVLTAGHCVYDHEYGYGWAEEVRVFPAYNRGEAGPDGSSSAIPAGLHSWSGWIDDADWDYDMAVITLDRPVGGLAGWLGYGSNMDPGFYVDNDFRNPGYPAEGPYDGRDLYAWNGTFDLGPIISLQAWIDRKSYGGQSGSPAYLESSQAIYGVLSHGGDDFTGFPLITSERFGFIANWISEDTPDTFDLIPLQVSCTPGPPRAITAGQRLTSFEYNIHNYSRAVWAGAVTVRVYLSPNRTISTVDTLISTREVTAEIGPKSTAHVNPITIHPPTIPLATPAGSYFLGVILDIDDHDVRNNDSSGQDAAEIQVEAAPEISISPTSLVSDCSPGYDATSDTFEVWNSGGDILDYSIQVNATWLSVNPTSGQSAGEHDSISVVYDTDSIPAGTYRANITVSATGARNSPVSIPVTLSVTGPVLDLEPSQLFQTCLEGENAPSQTFEVWNSGWQYLNYTITDDASWLRVSPASGGSWGEHETITILYDTSSLAVGQYVARIAVASPTAFPPERQVYVRLKVTSSYPGELDVEDSIAPEDDLSMPFGDVGLGDSRTEQITVRNLDSTRSLIVDDLGLGDQYKERFDASVTDWRETTDDQWRVVAAGKYRAHSPDWAYMTSFYRGKNWRDCTAQVSVSSSGFSNEAVLFVRATDDFVPGETGSAYGVSITSAQEFQVFKEVSGTLTYLHEPAWSPYLHSSSENNVMMFRASGSSLTVYLNGYVVWSGKDSSISASGRVGLGAVSTFGGATFWFDNVIVTKSLLRSGAWRLSGLPALPAVLTPGQSFSFDVTFSPTEREDYSSWMSLVTNDVSEPGKKVELTGAGERIIVPVTASIQVTIEPKEARDDGAQWSIDNGTSWHDSGEKVGVAVGAYEVTFKDGIIRPGSGCQSDKIWTTPASQTVEVLFAQTATATGVYELSAKTAMAGLPGGAVVVFAAYILLNVRRRRHL